MLSSKMLVCAMVLIAAVASAQTPPPANTTPPVDPGITQIRKSVTFIKLTCRDGAKEFDVRGTGFFVFYPDTRLGKEAGFVYLVTNRHVALCWNDSGHAMQVERISIRLNRRKADGENFSQEGFLNEHGNVPWVVPQDDSVDLAAFPCLPDEAKYDYKLIPVSIFATSDVLSQRKVTEGEPVFFAGFFHQFPGTKRMQPIVRQGIVAMMPDEKFPFVGQPEKLYLADVHVFGGNSGAPALST